MLPGVAIAQFFTASPKNTDGIIASRSMASDTARRNVGLLNHEYLTGSTNGSPDLLAGRGLLDSVQVEPEVVRVQVGSEIVQREVALLLVVPVPVVVFRLDVVEPVQFAGAEFQVGRIEIGHDQETRSRPDTGAGDSSCRRRSNTGCGPDGFLAGHVLRNAPRPARHDLVGRRARRCTRTRNPPSCTASSSTCFGMIAHDRDTFDQRRRSATGVLMTTV